MPWPSARRGGASFMARNSGTASLCCCSCYRYGYFRRLDLEWQWLLAGVYRPARGLAHRRVGITVMRSGSMHPQRFQMLRSPVTFIVAEIVLRINGVPVVQNPV